MREFLRNSNWWPNKPARLNTAHPFYSQRGFTCAAVANMNGGMTDLVTGTTAIGTGGVVNGVDENGPYVRSSTGTGTGTITFSGFGSAANGICMGLIFKHVDTTRTYMMTIAAGNNTGFWMNSVGSTVNFNLQGGIKSTTPALIAGHTYFLVMCNGPATIGQTMVCFCYDMTSGQVLSIYGIPAAGNLAPYPIEFLVPYTSLTSNQRIYAGFACGASGQPGDGTYPANAPPFYSQAALMDAAANPWSLWYA
jgi:hypothetical protein